MRHITPYIHITKTIANILLTTAAVSIISYISYFTPVSYNTLFTEGNLDMYGTAVNFDIE